MNLLIAILSILILTVFFYSRHIKYLRFKYICRLKSKQEDMEMFFVLNDVKFTRDHKEYLRTLKVISENPGFLDIQFLLMSMIFSRKEKTLNKNVEWFKKVEQSLPDDFKILIQEFDQISDKIIDLSFMKPDFVLFLTKCTVRKFVKSRLSVIQDIRNDLSFAKNNEGAISYSAMQVV